MRNGDEFDLFIMNFAYLGWDLSAVSVQSFVRNVRNKLKFSKITVCQMQDFTTAAFDFDGFFKTKI